MFNRGTIVGSKYLICHLIAEGGLAEIYLAQTQMDMKNGLVAIKRLKSEYCNNAEILRRFAAEGRLLLAMQHPLVLRGIEYICEDSEQLIVMELVRGKELRYYQTTFNQAAPNDKLKAVLSLGILISHALSNLFKNESNKYGFVHGDLSPENIMICVDNSVKIIDFGSSFIISEKNSNDAHIIIANQCYMAPEQKIDGVIREQGDVYSLSLVLAELLGACPEGSDHSVIKATKQLLARALSPDLQIRPSGMQALLKDLLFLAEHFAPLDPAYELRTFLENNQINKKARPSTFSNVH